MRELVRITTPRLRAIAVERGKDPDAVTKPELARIRAVDEARRLEEEKGIPIAGASIKGILGKTGFTR